MIWQERASELTGAQDYIHRQLNQEGYKVTRAQVRDYLKPPAKTETVTINADGTTSERIIKASADEIGKAEFLLKQHGFDDTWELVSARSSIWDAQTPDGMDTMYSSRITVKPRTTVSPEDMLRHFTEQAQKYSPVQPRKIKTCNENVFIINVSDLHLGQLSWGAESGENYDYKIASERFKDIVSDAIVKSPHKEYERIYFIKGNDFFNSDNSEGSTTAGTRQTNDVRPQKMFDKGVDLWVWGVDALRTAYPTSPIETLLVPGNHERLTAYYAAKYLYAWFRNDSTVTVDVSPRLHKGFAYGNTALLFTHGQNELKNLDWVYTEFRKLIGATETTEIHAGHQHRVKVEEKNGALLRVNPAPAALNSWSYGEGYGSVAQSISRVYSRKGIEYEIYSRV